LAKSLLPECDDFSNSGNYGLTTCIVGDYSIVDGSPQSKRNAKTRLETLECVAALVVQASVYCIVTNGILHVADACPRAVLEALQCKRLSSLRFGAL
jgi:hypothetical protein